MSIALSHVTIDCADPYELAGFWHEVTGWPRPDDDHPGDPEASLFPPNGGTGLWFQVVPEPKTIKNRVHLDLKPTGRTRDEEIARIGALGAAFIEDHRRPDGSGWVVLADPAGNEFCVLHSDAESAASG
jgi:predicted enzyme related to lactoylglutathione lyase